MKNKCIEKLSGLCSRSDLFPHSLNWVFFSNYLHNMYIKGRPVWKNVNVGTPPKCLRREQGSSLRRDTFTLLQSWEGRCLVAARQWVWGEGGVVLKSLQGTHTNQSPLLTPAKPWCRAPSQKCALGKAMLPLPSHLAHIPDSMGMRRQRFEPLA